MNPPQAARPAKPQDQRRLKAIEPVQAALESDRVAEGWQHGQAALRRYPSDPQLHLMMAALAERMGAEDRARHHAEQAMKQGPNAGALVALSRIERRAGNTDRALHLIDDALKMVPGDLPLLMHRVGTLEEAGRLDEARAVIDPMIERLEAEGRPLPPHLRYELAKLLIHEKDYQRAVEVVDAFAADAATPRTLSCLGYYLRAKAQDRSGDYAAAFGSATIANDKGREAWDPAAYEQQVTRVIETWTAENMADFPLSTCQSEVPIFVAGMPRSGTSLIDQIIDAHPRAAGVGELSSIERFAAQLDAAYNADAAPAKRFGSINRFRWTRVADDYVKELGTLAPGADRVVNKAMGNNRLVGLLARLFPRTRIIHAMRDPRDVAISCYMGAFNNVALPWTTRLDWVAHAWEQSERMMAHWAQTLDIPILDLRYEDLVSDPGTQFPRLIEFIGLEWDDACREFYKSRRTVRTLSYDQVNRPLYTTSAGRHANYAEQIAGVDFPEYPAA
ncbi:MAG: sulfotransferase [Planctomycetota bacterium]